LIKKKNSQNSRKLSSSRLWRSWPVISSSNWAQSSFRMNSSSAVKAVLQKAEPVCLGTEGDMCVRASADVHVS
jgi:hypothetical protein